MYVGQYQLMILKKWVACLKSCKGDTWEVGIVWSDKFGEHQGYARIKSVDLVFTKSLNENSYCCPNSVKLLTIVSVLTD